MGAVEIVLTGVVYLLGTSSSAIPGNVTAIIPNASAPSAPYGHVIPDHYAYVKVRTMDVVDFEKGTLLRPPDFVFRTDNKLDLVYENNVCSIQHSATNPEFAVFGLNGDRIELSGTDLTKNPLEICRMNCGAKLDGSPKDSYDRVPHRKVICPDCGGLDSLFTSTGDHQTVLGRMTFDRGTLSSAHIDTEEWSFEPMHLKTAPAGMAEQTYPHFKIADQAVLDIAATTGNVTLKIVPFDGGADVVTLELKGGAQVEIGNLMPADILPFLAHHAPPAVDPHFGFFYTMLTRPITQHPGPISDPRIPHRMKFPPPNPGGPRQDCVPLADEY